MTKNLFPSTIQFIDIEELEKNRFQFVSNEMLRENICIGMQYIVFLISLEEEYELPGTVRYSTFKSIVLYTASIVESLLNYKLKDLIKGGRIKGDEIMEYEFFYPEIKELYKISETEKICGVKKIKKVRKLSDETDFASLNKASKKCGLLNDSLFRKTEKLRKMRNTIHLSALKDSEDDKYTKSDISDVFSIAKDIIRQIEKY